MCIHLSGARVYGFHQILREVTNPPNIKHLSSSGSLTLPMQFGLRNKVICHVRILIEVGQQDLGKSQVGSPFWEWGELQSGFPFCCPEAAFVSGLM